MKNIDDLNRKRFATYYQKLAHHDSANLWRERLSLASQIGPWCGLNNHTVLNFSSNDYLGLSNNCNLKEAAITSIGHLGVGSGASAQVCGYHQVHYLAEQKLGFMADFEFVTLFSSGYLANLALMQCFGENTSIFLDKLAHASMLDGAALTKSVTYRFGHQNLSHLSLLLKKHHNNKPPLIGVEGVYSMTGDSAPLPDLVDICHKSSGVLVIDDAHGFGVMGPNGRGSHLVNAIASDAPIIYMATLGKAMGCHGAFVATNHKVLHDMIQQFARSYRYTTSLPFHMAEAVTAAIGIIDSDTNIHQRLRDNISYWQSLCQNKDWPTSNSAIQLVPYGDCQQALDVSRYLFEAGFYVKAMRPPTIPKALTGLRITLSSFHTKEMIKSLFEALTEANKKLNN